MLACAAAALTHAQETGPDGAGAALEEFVATVDTLTATFTQETWTADQELIDTATGRFSLVRPDRFIWHYDTPFEQLVVADGAVLWMYDVELAQVTRTPLEDLPASNLGILLSGRSAVSEGFEIAEQPSVDGREWLKLIPKSAGGDFSSVLLAFRGGAPEELELVDGLNQTTRIAFSDIEINPDLDLAQFEFEPPPGADVIGDDSD